MPKRILIIDDEIDFTEVVSTLLRFHDFEVDTFNDPTFVLEALQKNHYDLIVSDLMMPHIDGFELIQKIQAMEKYRQSPIIVLSAKVLTDEERKFLFKNKVHCLPKPFEPRGLVEQICQLMETSIE